MAGPPGFEPGNTNSGGWRLIQARLRPQEAKDMESLKGFAPMTGFRGV
jgi:hypothetical protein